MLNKGERVVIEYVYSKCKQTGDCLISEQEILVEISHKIKLTSAKLKEILKVLSLEEYIDITYTDRRGEEVLVILLKPRGKAYPREKIQIKRQIKQKILLAIGGALLSFVVGKILLIIFS